MYGKYPLRPTYTFRLQGQDHIPHHRGYDFACLIAAYEKLDMKLQVLDLHAECDLFPINVPLITDKRAAADRTGKPKITSLAETIVAQNPNSIVVGNGIDFSDPRVKSFQRAKGLNGLEHNDIFVHPDLLSCQRVRSAKRDWSVVRLARSDRLLV